MDARIGHLHAHYRFLGPPEAGTVLGSRLDALARARVAAEYGDFLAEALGSDPAVYVVRRISCRLDLVLGRDSDERLARHWGAAMAAAVLREIDGSLADDSPAAADAAANVVTFANQAHYVAQFLTDLVAGRAWDHWYYGAFAAYRDRGLAAAARAVLEDNLPHLPAILACLHANAGLEPLLALLGSSGRAWLWRQTRGDPALAQAGLRPIFAVALRLAAHLGIAANAAVLWPRYLDTGPAPADWRDRVSLAAAVLAALEFLAAQGTRAPARAMAAMHPAVPGEAGELAPGALPAHDRVAQGAGPPAAPPVVPASLLAELDWLDTNWLQAALAAWAARDRGYDLMASLGREGAGAADRPLAASADVPGPEAGPAEAPATRPSIAGDVEEADRSTAGPQLLAASDAMPGGDTATHLPVLRRRTGRDQAQGRAARHSPGEDPYSAPVTMPVESSAAAAVTAPAVSPPSQATTAGSGATVPPPSGAEAAGPSTTAGEVASELPGGSPGRTEHQPPPSVGESATTIASAEDSASALPDDSLTRPVEDRPSLPAGAAVPAAPSADGSPPISSPSALPAISASRDATPRQRELLADLTAILQAGGPDLDPAEPASAANALRLYAWLVSRAPGWSGDSLATGTIATLLSAWSHIARSTAPRDTVRRLAHGDVAGALAALGSAARAAAAADFAQVARLGAAATPLLQALTSRSTEPARPAAAGTASACAGIALLWRAVLDARLPAILSTAAYPADDPAYSWPATWLALAGALAGPAAAAGGHLDPGLHLMLDAMGRGLEVAHLLAAWPAITPAAQARFQTAWLRTLFGLRLLEPRALLLHRLDTRRGPLLVGADAGGHLWPFAAAVPADRIPSPDQNANGPQTAADRVPDRAAVHGWLAAWQEVTGAAPALISADMDLAGPDVSVLTPEDAEPDQAKAYADSRAALEAALAALDEGAATVPGTWPVAPLLAAGLLRIWARWLRGFSGASVPYLLNNFIRRPGRLHIAEDQIVVELTAGPLDIVLELAGYLAPLEQVPWLGKRTVRYVIGGM